MRSSRALVYLCSINYSMSHSVVETGSFEVLRRRSSSCSAGISSAAMAHPFFMQSKPKSRSASALLQHTFRSFLLYTSHTQVLNTILKDLCICLLKSIRSLCVRDASIPQLPSSTTTFTHSLRYSSHYSMHLKADSLSNTSLSPSQELEEGMKLGNGSLTVKTCLTFLQSSILHPLFLTLLHFTLPTPPPPQTTSTHA